MIELKKLDDYSDKLDKLYSKKEKIFKKRKKAEETLKKQYERELKKQLKLYDEPLEKIITDYNTIYKSYQNEIYKIINASTFDARFIGNILAQIITEKTGKNFQYREEYITRKEMVYQYGDRWEENIRHRCRLIVTDNVCLSANEQYINMLLEKNDFYILEEDYFGNNISFYKGLTKGVGYYGIKQEISLPPCEEFLDLIIKYKLNNPNVEEDEIQKIAEEYIKTIKPYKTKKEKSLSKKFHQMK